MMDLRMQTIETDWKRAASKERWFGSAEGVTFVARSEELSRLEILLFDAKNGKGGLAFVSGEAGIGKTTLAQEVSRRAQEMGFLTLLAKCKSGPSSPIYFPWIEFVRQLSQLTSASLFFKSGGPNIGQVVRLVPELSESLPSNAFSPSTTAEAQSPHSNSLKNPQEIQLEENQFHSALTQFFLRLSLDSPILLILDDLQWCDEASLKLLCSLVSGCLSDSRILILCLYRDIDLKEEKNLHVKPFLDNLMRMSKPLALSLSRFDQRSVAQLIEALFPQSEGSADFTKTIHSRTGGNPLFVSETIKSLHERGLITRGQRGKWVFPSSTQLQLPDTLKEVIEQRLARLDCKTMEVLKAASVLGEQFCIETVQTVAAAHLGVQPPVQDLLNNALNSGLILETQVKGTRRYQFSDEFVRDSLYDMLAEDQRRRLHTAAAEALERNALDKEHFSELAHQFLKGGNQAKAREYFVMAGKHASEFYAHAEAYRHYSAALDLSEATYGVESKLRIFLRAEILGCMGDEAQFLPQYQEAPECWRRAAELYESVGQNLRAAEAYVRVGMSYHLVTYELEKSREVLEKAVQLAENSSGAPSAELARITAYSMVADIWRSDRPKVKEKSALAVRLAKESGAMDVIAMVSSYVIATDGVAEIDQSIESCNKGLEVSHQYGLTWEASYNYFHRAVSYLYTNGPSPKALELFQEGLKFTLQRGNFMVNLFHKVELAYGVYLPLGDWKKAREVAEESLASIQTFPKSSLFRLIAESAMGQVLLHEGDLDGAEGYLEHVREVTKGFGVLQIDVPLYIALAKLNMERGNFEKTEKYLKEGYRLTKQRGLTVINAVPHVQIVSSMIDYLLLRGSSASSEFCDTFRIESLLSDVAYSAREINKEWALAYLFKEEGLVAAHNKQIEKAVVSIQKSIEIFERLSWEYELAKTRYALGVIQLKRGNSLTASGLLNSALEIFSRLGAKRDIESIMSLKKRIDERGYPILDVNPRFQNKEGALVYETLVTEFMQDLLFNKLEVDKCGWRSLSRLRRELKLSKNMVYGKGRRTSTPLLNDLLSSGSVESKLFAGERGRGGEVLKIRIVFGKSALSRFSAKEILREVSVSRETG
jgi:tetratricopeptide (TPR) repeat protein